MKITFPHMGFMHIPLKSLLQGLHREVVVPPPISERTLALGLNMRLNSPVCRLRSVWAIILRPWKPARIRY